MSEKVRVTKSGNVAVVTIDNPPVNALGQAVRQGLVKAMSQLEADDNVGAVVIHGAGRTFSAGADINEFDTKIPDPDFDVLLGVLENSRCPVIVAIHGMAFGGGLETAMACDYRVAEPTARCGQPEVHLGIIPGAGGTQRLPRLIGVEAALSMITSGKPISAVEAHQLGLIDALIEGDLVEGAVSFAEQVIAEGAAKRRTRDLDVDVENMPPDLLGTVRESTARQSKGFEAPLRCIDAVEAATKLPFEEGMAAEATIFADCVTSQQSQALRYLFFAERECAKIPDVPPDTPVKEIRSAAVLGAGTMGTGIAINFASIGIPVHLLDQSPDALQRASANIKKNFDRMASKGRISQDEAQERTNLVHPVQDYSALSQVDIVVEAVFEDMEIKHQVFEKLNDVVNSEAVLATNTSTLDIDEISAHTNRPDKVIGLHFFSPANIMKLVELVRADKTSPETIATSMALVKAMKKVGVLVKVCDGFVGNRMVFPYVREACFLLEEGVLPHQVDKALEDFGFAMGPHAMCDMAGQDVFWLIRQRQASTRPVDARYSALQDKICEMKRFGQKSGAGIYRYEKGNRSPVPDPEIEAMIVEESQALGIVRREISEEEIVERCVFALINEGAKILEEGIALRPGDIDIVYRYGYGFPGHRGGPMIYADTVGLRRVYDRICQFAETQPLLWQPARLLEELANNNGCFCDV